MSIEKNKAKEACAQPVTPQQQQIIVDTLLESARKVVERQTKSNSD